MKTGRFIDAGKVMNNELSDAARTAARGKSPTAVGSDMDAGSQMIGAVLA